MSVKVSFKTVIKDLNGDEIIFKEKPLTVGRSIGIVLASDKSSDPLRAWVLAQDAYKNDDSDLDTSEINFIKEAVKATNQFTPLVIAQVLQALDEAKKNETGEKTAKK